MRIARFPRQEFLRERWNYRPGEHVGLTAPTQNGKTHLLFELLANTDTSWCEVPPVVLVGKPKDPEVARNLQRAGFRETPVWPPTKRPFSEKPPGYALWPRHIKDVDNAVNVAHLNQQFRPALRQLFWRGNTIAVADETYFLCGVLRLEEELTAHWTQGAGMGSGLWDATQKPSGTAQGSIPTFRYNSAVHTFLGRDPDKRNRDRFGEIGGVDPRFVSEAVLSLRKFEWLYINRDGPTMCIVEAQ